MITKYTWLLLLLAVPVYPAHEKQPCPPHLVDIYEGAGFETRAKGLHVLLRMERNEITIEEAEGLFSGFLERLSLDPKLYKGQPLQLLIRFVRAYSKYFPTDLSMAPMPTPGILFRILQTVQTADEAESVLRALKNGKMTEVIGRLVGAPGWGEEFSSWATDFERRHPAKPKPVFPEFNPVELLAKSGIAGIEFYQDLRLNGGLSLNFKKICSKLNSLEERIGCLFELRVMQVLSAEGEKFLGTGDVGVRHLLLRSSDPVAAQKMPDFLSVILTPDGVVFRLREAKAGPFKYDGINKAIRQLEVGVQALWSRIDRPRIDRVEIVVPNTSLAREQLTGKPLGENRFAALSDDGSPRVIKGPNHPPYPITFRLVNWKP